MSTKNCNSSRGFCVSTFCEPQSSRWKQRDCVGALMRRSKLSAFRMPESIFSPFVPHGAEIYCLSGNRRLAHISYSPADGVGTATRKLRKVHGTREQFQRVRGAGLHAHSRG